MAATATVMSTVPAPLDPAVHTERSAAERQLADLMAAHERTVLRYALRWTSGDAQRAEDVAQETWVRAWRNLDKVTNGRGSVRAWLLRVAHNIAVDQHRSRTSRPAEVAIDEEFDRPTHEVDATDGVLGQLSLQATLDRVPEPVRDVLVEVYVHDRTAKQAALRLGIPVGTVKSRLHYGLANLRAELTGARFAVA